MNVEQQQAQRIAGLEAELERLRAAATADLQSVQNLLLAETRKVGLLKSELSKRDESSPEAKDAKELLVLWRDTIRGGHKSTDISVDSDRGRATMRAIKRFGHERVRRAILGCQFDDWAMGRTSKQDRPYSDIAKHILKDSDRFEHFEKLYLEHHPDAQTKHAVTPAAQLALVDREVSPVERVLERLPYPFTGTTEGGYLSRCPSCDVRDHSLSIRVLENRDAAMVLIDCYAGCSRADITDTLGLAGSDLVQSKMVLNEYPAPFPLPAHLREAMQQLLERGYPPLEVAA